MFVPLERCAASEPSNSARAELGKKEEGGDKTLVLQDALCVLAASAVSE
jgi:hypothetical protein